MIERKITFLMDANDGKESSKLIPSVVIDDDGDCYFNVVDINDDAQVWCIGYICSTTGELTLCSDLPDNIGLAVGKEGHILTTKE